VLALEVAYLPQCDAAAQVLVVICVTAWAAEGTFSRDLDRKVRLASREYLSPGAEDTVHAQVL
jgi:hypothetical protein